MPTLSWPATKLYFAVLNAFSLGIVALFAYQVGRSYGRPQGWGMLTSVLAMGSNSFALGAAQYGLVVNAMIVCMAYCLTTQRPVSAGLFYGLSLVKTAISAPFVFIIVSSPYRVGKNGAKSGLITSQNHLF
jgi:hypothetical protein